VLSFAEAADHPHNRSRQTIAGSPPQPSPAPRFDGRVAPIEPAGALTLADALARWA
jgi:alpha-methylacyl-CoA racemase